MSEEGFGRWRENQEYVAVAASHDLLSHMWHSSSVYRRRCVKQRERSENLPVPYFLFFFFTNYSRSEAEVASYSKVCVQRVMLVMETFCTWALKHINTNKYTLTQVKHELSKTS